MTEQTEEKKSSRKRKVASTEEVERKTTPKRAAKTKTEEAKAAAASTAAVTSGTSSSKPKKKKTEKTEGEETSSLPKQKQFLANAKDLQVVISDAPLVQKEEGDGKADKQIAEEETTDPKNGADQISNPLFTLIAKPNKYPTGYGWSATLAKAKIKIEIDGNQVELPATINLNITVGKK